MELGQGIPDPAAQPSDKPAQWRVSVPTCLNWVGSRERDAFPADGVG